MTTEFVRSASRIEAPPFCLIEQKGLVSRLIQELEAALGELTRDPGSFVAELFSADTKDAKRRQRIYVGLACAVVAHAALLVFIAMLGWRTMFVKHPVEARSDVVWVPISNPSEKPIGTDANIPRGDKDVGGGGGGDKNPLPATKGPLPLMSPGPQIVKPNTPSVKLPAIQVPPTIVGPDSSPPPAGIALGIPTGVIAEAPSPGPGGGEGLGGNRGSGAGPGSGPGSGKGGPGGAGDKGRFGSPTGRDDVKGPIPYNLIRSMPDATDIVWLRRVTATITPEAQINKTTGEVWLRATFREDGTITDIEVMTDVPYMTESAIEALRRCTFRPATVKGRPVTLTRVPVRITVHVVQR